MTSVYEAAMERAPRQPQPARVYPTRADYRLVASTRGFTPPLDDDELARRVVVVSTTFGLTLREVQILSLIALGCTNFNISARLYIAEDTVKSHLAHILVKLDARNRLHAVALVLARGLPDSGDSDDAAEAVASSQDVPSSA